MGFAFESKTNWFNIFFDSVSEILKKSDITFGNLEGVIMSEQSCQSVFYIV